MSREKFGSRGYVFAQIGLNAEPCSVNCRFCSLGADHYSLDGHWQKDVSTLKEELNRLQKDGIDDFFLMSTADYSISKLLRIAREVKPLLKEDQKFVVNTGDFDFETAKELKNAGFTGVYHINRLREGVDTKCNPLEREKTIEALRKAGMELYYCIVLNHLIISKELIPHYELQLLSSSFRNIRIKLPIIFFYILVPIFPWALPIPYSVVPSLLHHNGYGNAMQGCCIFNRQSFSLTRS
jgi:hypothetical protein